MMLFTRQIALCNINKLPLQLNLDENWLFSYHTVNKSTEAEQIFFAGSSTFKFSPNISGIFWKPV